MFYGEDGYEAAEERAIEFDVQLVGAFEITAAGFQPGMVILIGCFAPDCLKGGVDAGFETFIDASAQAVPAVGIHFFAAVFAQVVVAAEYQPVFRQGVDGGGEQKRLRAVEMF